MDTMVKAASPRETPGLAKSHPHLRAFASKPLRVAMIAPPYFDIPPKAYGGVEAVVADLCDALGAEGHQVTLVGAGANGTKADFVPVWEQAIPQRLGEPYPEIGHAALTRNAVAQLARTQGVDVVHDHTGAGPLNAPYYAALGIPTVVTAHGPVTGDLNHLYTALADSIHLVAISHRQRQLAPRLPWAGTVHNGLDITTWPYQQRKQDYALFIGRFHPDKGAHLALDAAHAAGMPLVLAGKCAEPAEQQYLEQEIKPRLRDSDRLFGMADAAQKRRLFAGARCLLFPVQWEEPFGMVMIEAMACGTPVVALAAGAVPEVVVHGQTGLICTHPHQLPEALHKIDDIDPAACRAHVAQRFSTSRLAAGYTSVYRRVISKHRLPQGQPAPAAAGTDVRSQLFARYANHGDVRAQSAVATAGSQRSAVPPLCLFRHGDVHAAEEGFRVQGIF